MIFIYAFPVVSEKEEEKKAIGAFVSALLHLGFKIHQVDFLIIGKD